MALFWCNLAGALLVHQAARLQSFRHMKDTDSIGVYWRKALKAWMTCQIVIDWFGTCFISDASHYYRRLGLPFKVLLLLGNTLPHPQFLIWRHKCVCVLWGGDHLLLWK